VLSSALDREPTNDEARYNLAVAEFQTGQYSPVLETLNPLLERDPPDPESLGLAAEACESLFDTPRAVDLLKKGIAAYPGNPEFYVAFANLSLTHSSFQVGVDVVNAGIARLPGEASLHFARGILFLEMGEYDKSERDFDLVEALDPAMPVGPAASALAKLERHQPKEAERIAGAQLANHTDDPYLNYVLAEAIRSQGPPPDSDEFREAQAAAEKAVKVQPKFASARLVLSRLYMQSGKFDRAAIQAQEAVKLAPDNVTIMYNLILATNRAGRAEQLPTLIRRLNELKEAASQKRHQLRQYTLAERPPENEPPRIP
jgi:tetratricopeptide (TPR) repeat protein